LDHMKKSFQKTCRHCLAIAVILFLVLVADIIVFLTGGTGFSFPHLMYFPILAAAFLFEIPGGALTGLIAGITLGPLMPLDAAAGISQTTTSWLFRIAFFVLMGTLAGYLFRLIRLDRDRKIKESYIHYLTGYPNQNKLRSDLCEMIEKGRHSTLLIIKIINLGYINRYADYQIEESAIFYVINTILKHFEWNSLYCMARNEYVLVFPGRSIQDVRIKTEHLMEKFMEPVLIEGMPVDLIIRSGIVNFPFHSMEANDLLKKLERTLDQDKYEGNKLSVYQNEFAERNKENYERMVALYEAIKNNEFTIVYQPKINIRDNTVMGLEALLRWVHPVKGNIRPDEFIPLAEYMGMINEITKWVVKNVIDQIKIWSAEGFSVPIAINISSKDLRDETIIEYTRKYLETTGVNAELLEFELTERTIVDNEKLAGGLLEKISELGLSISLDDFGTGYNSLIHLVNLPIDYVKLDKFFVKSMKESSNISLIQGVINTVHSLGMSIVAEGVETSEQAEILRRMGCDIIQGYYYSKPLPPLELKEYLRKFNT